MPPQSPLRRGILDAITSMSAGRAHEIEDFGLGAWNRRSLCGFSPCDDAALRLPGRVQMTRCLFAKAGLHARHPWKRLGGPGQARQGSEDQPGPGRALGTARADALALL